MSDLIKLSASRIKTLQSCSWIYNCNYHLKLPQKNNSGAKRGTIAHLIFEVLANPRHSKYLKEIETSNTCLKISSIFKLIKKTAKKEKLDLNEDVPPLKKGGETISCLKCIDEMIIVGLRFDFLDSLTNLIGSEIEFDFENESPKYRIGGFIDRVFEKNNQLIIRDFKSSKQLFKGEELTSNMQAMIYALAMRKKYGEQYQDILVKFLFLRYPQKPEQDCPQFSQQELDGFEYFLEYISKYLQNFDETKALSNLAAHSYEKKWMCKTKSGWKCPYIDKFEYKVLLDNNKKIIKSIHADEEFSNAEIKDGMTIEARIYEGCPAWKKDNEFDF
jgi:hypothetical protein